MGLQLPPLALLALALTLVLAGCGGGTTAPPPPTTIGSASAAASARTTAAPASRPATSTSAPAAARTTAVAHAPAASTQATSRTVPPRTVASAPTTAPAAAAAPRSSAPKPVTVSIDELADLALTRRASPAHYFQAGTVTGTYAGTMSVEARVTSQGVLVAFTATVPGGTIVGHAVAVAVIDGSPSPALRGTGEITGGTGRFVGVRGRDLRVTGRARPDASHARVRLTGTVTLSR